MQRRRRSREVPWYSDEDYEEDADEDYEAEKKKKVRLEIAELKRQIKKEEEKLEIAELKRELAMYEAKYACQFVEPCNTCGVWGHYSNTCTFVDQCSHCGYLGHSINNCQLLQDWNRHLDEMKKLDEELKKKKEEDDKQREEEDKRREEERKAFNIWINNLNISLSLDADEKEVEVSSLITKLVDILHKSPSRYVPGSLKGLFPSQDAKPTILAVPPLLSSTCDIPAPIPTPMVFDDSIPSPSRLGLSKEEIVKKEVEERIALALIKVELEDDFMLDDSLDLSVGWLFPEDPSLEVDSSIDMDCDLVDSIIMPELEPKVVEKICEETRLSTFEVDLREIKASLHELLPTPINLTMVIDHSRFRPPKPIEVTSIDDILVEKIDLNLVAHMEENENFVFDLIVVDDYSRFEPPKTLEQYVPLDACCAIIHEVIDYSRFRPPKQVEFFLSLFINLAIFARLGDLFLLLENSKAWHDRHLFLDPG